MGTMTGWSAMGSAPLRRLRVVFDFQSTQSAKVVGAGVRVLASPAEVLRPAPARSLAELDA